MADDLEGTIRKLVEKATLGDPRSAEELLPVLYDQLRQLASARVARTPPGNTVQATELVHEAYLRLVGDGDPGWDGRGHFFGAAARAMRDVLVDRLRARIALKRGGDRKREPLDSQILVDGTSPSRLLDLDAALTTLEQSAPRASRVVELRYFAGLTLPEIAQALQVSQATAEREWAYARAWLFERLGDTSGDPA